MRHQRRIFSFLLGLMVMGAVWEATKLNVCAEETEIPGYCEYIEREGESIVHWYGVARGTYLKEGICGIVDEKNGKVTVSGTTTAHKICDTMKVAVYLDESSDSGQSFSQIGSYYYSRNDASSCHGSKAGITVTSGWWYMVRGGHSAIQGTTTESMTTRSKALKIS